MTRKLKFLAICLILLLLPACGVKPLKSAVPKVVNPKITDEYRADAEKFAKAVVKMYITKNSEFNDEVFLKTVELVLFPESFKKMNFGFRDEWKIRSVETIKVLSSEIEKSGGDFNNNIMQPAFSVDMIVKTIQDGVNIEEQLTVDVYTDGKKFMTPDVYYTD